MMIKATFLINFKCMLDFSDMVLISLLRPQEYDSEEEKNLIWDRVTVFFFLK